MLCVNSIHGRSVSLCSMFLLCCMVVVTTVAHRAGAMVITPDTTGRDSEPIGGRGWSNVGRMSTGTGVYLGNWWVLTAHHVYDDVSGQSILFDGVTYPEVSDTAVRLKNPDDTFADLTLFRIDGETGLDAMPIRQNTPPVNTDVTTITVGRVQESAQTTWYIDTDPTDWIWSETDFEDADITKTGWDTLSARDKLWGENVVEPDGFITPDYMFRTDFDDVDGDMQGVTLDSGGGVFTYNSSSQLWELAGVILSVRQWNNQPNKPGSITTSVYGNSTFMANLSLYTDQISDTIAGTGPHCPGDVNEDGTVDTEDLAVLLQNFDTAQEGWEYGDLVDNDFVDTNDLASLLQNWGATCTGAEAEPERFAVQIPEPASVFLVSVGMCAVIFRKRRRPE